MRQHSPLLPLILGALAALPPLAVDMYLPAIPTIARDLGSDVSAVQLTVSTFLAGFAIGQLFYGPISDSVGRKPVLLFGVGLFILAYRLCLCPLSALVAGLPSAAGTGGSGGRRGGQCPAAGSLCR